MTTTGRGWQAAMEGMIVANDMIAGRRPRIGPLRDGVGAGRFQHSEWTALLGRFVLDGRVDYGTMVRVRRLVETYIGRLAEQDPEGFIDADDQLAFYINAYNVIAIHQVLLHYPVRSIRDVPWAFLRPYPIGRRNLSLHTLHSNVLRSFGDPRIHAAICGASMSFPALPTQAYMGVTLQASLDEAMRRFLGDDRRGLCYDPATNTVVLSPILRLFGGDFVQPHAMPGASHLVQPVFQPQQVLVALEPWLVSTQTAAIRNHPAVRFATFDWQLNEQRPAKTARENRAR